MKIHKDTYFKLNYIDYQFLFYKVRLLYIIINKDV